MNDNWTWNVNIWQNLCTKSETEHNKKYNEPPTLLDHFLYVTLIRITWLISDNSLLYWLHTCKLKLPLNDGLSHSETWHYCETQFRPDTHNIISQFHSLYKTFHIHLREFDAFLDWKILALGSKQNANLCTSHTNFASFRKAW